MSNQEGKNGMEQKKGIRISFNAPVILTFSLLCLAALIAGMLTGDKTTTLLFSVYRCPLTDPLGYVRLFGHVLGHSGVQHLIGNLMFILVVGPLLEEKYGSVDILCVILITALVTGVIHCLLFPGAALLGASGVVFALILLSSFTGLQEGKIPLTFLVVALLYLGQEVYQAVFVADNVSNLTHILGGLVGALLGYLMSRHKLKASQTSW